MFLKILFDFKPKLKFLFLIICTLYFNTNCSAQEKIDSKFERYFQTYGYLTGQNISIERIKKSFPALKNMAYDLEKKFNLKFPLVAEKLESNLNKISAEAFKELKTEVISKLLEITDNSILTSEDANSFLLELADRIDGKIPSPFLETILFFTYDENPHMELKNGFYYNFKTKGHEKSKKTDWQINIPKSWKKLEADRPNIIQKFVSNYGDGHQSIMMLVIDLPKDSKISESDDSNDILVESFKEYLPKEAKLISLNKITIDNKKGYMFEIEQTVQKLDIQISIRMMQYSFINANQMYILQGSVMELESENQDLEKTMHTYKPLFKSIANSIVVNSNYNYNIERLPVSKFKSGSGFALTNDGLIATNYHVVQNSKKIIIRGIDGNFNKSINCKLIAADELNDIAILRIDTPHFSLKYKIPYVLKPINSNVGASVFVLGYPLRQSMGDEIKLTNGIISSQTGFAGNMSTYQTSAPVQPGNSGCPLFNSEASLIGIVSSKHPDAENATYAIKISYLIKLVEKIKVNINSTLPNELKNLSLSEQVESLKKFVYIIETETN
jgi:S1-C subfamily serine protease